MKSDRMKRTTSTDSENTKSRNRLLIIAGLVAISVGFSSSLAIAEEDERPFSANFTGALVAPLTFAGTGIATHLGNFDLVGYRDFSSPPSPSNPCVGFQYIILALTAANGDELWLNATSGELCFDFSHFPVSISFAGDADFVAIGGTGRFSDSTGNFQMFWSGATTSSGASFTGELWGVVGY
jgi:hypothetical protein